MTNKRNWVQFRITKNDFKKGLLPNEVLILKAIQALDKGQGCFATNSYFSEYFNIAPVTVSRAITKLQKAGYINVYFERKNRNTVKRTIKPISVFNYSEKSQVLGIIKYINGLYKKEYDYTPLRATPEIKKAVQNKLEEFKSQKLLIQYLKKHREDLASTSGASLWLQGKLSDKYFIDQHW